MKSDRLLNCGSFFTAMLFFPSIPKRINIKCFAAMLTTWSINTCVQRRLRLMSAPVETLSRAITGGLRWAPLFHGANQDRDYYLARAASLRRLETCFPKETTEGQLLSAELFSLLSMCVLAACLWPTDPERQHETGLQPPTTPLSPKYPLLAQASEFFTNSQKMHT